MAAPEETLWQFFRDRPGRGFCASCVAAELSIGARDVRRLAWHPIIAIEFHRGSCSRCASAKPVFSYAGD